VQQGHIDAAVDVSTALVVVGGPLIDGVGTYTVANKHDDTRMYRASERTVTVRDGNYISNALDNFAMRMGLPTEDMFAVKAHLAALGQDPPPLFIHPIHYNKTIVTFLRDSNTVQCPQRQLLGSSPLQYPPLGASATVKQQSAGKRGRSHGDAPTASSAVPPRRRQLHPYELAAQQRLVAIRSDVFLVVLHTQTTHSTTFFTKELTGLSKDIPAQDMWRPYQFMWHANRQRYQNAHGQQRVHLRSLLPPYAPRSIYVHSVLDVAVVTKATIADVKAGRKWMHRDGPRPSLHTLLQSKSTAATWHKAMLARTAATDARADDGAATTTAKDDTGVYEVQQIVDCRHYQGSVHYKVRWVGFSAADDTWEPADNVAHANDLVQAYLRSAPPMWQGVRERFKWEALAFAGQVHVLDVDGTWKLAVVTAVHLETRSVSIVTHETSSIQKSRQHSIDKQTWLRDLPSAKAALVTPASAPRTVVGR
jgi:hypothetical protein